MCGVAELRREGGETGGRECLSVEAANELWCLHILVGTYWGSPAQETHTGVRLICLCGCVSEE